MLVGGGKYRSDLQGLRAVAVTLVVLAHANVPGFAGGFIGVDVFFVLSGFLITGLLVEERLTSGTIVYGRFLARRLRRLLPAMMAMIIVTFLVASVVLTEYEMRMQSGSYPFASAWVSNFYFAFSERSYFSALQSEDLFLHTWSLGVEEQFYLLWPWLILVLFSSKAGNNHSSSQRTIVLTALMLVFVVSLSLGLYLSKTLPMLSFYMMPPRAWQFAIGSAVYVYFLYAPQKDNVQKNIRSGKKAAMRIGSAGFLLVFGSALMLGPDFAYPSFYALFPSVGAALIIAAGTLYEFQLASGLLRTRLLVWLGDRSYSVYLWHWPVLVLGKSLGVSASPVGVVLLIGIVLILAAGSYRAIELPFWKGRIGNRAPRQVMLYSLLAVSVALSIGKLLEHEVYGLDESVLADNTRLEPRYDFYGEVYTGGRRCDSGTQSAELIPCQIGAAYGIDGEKNSVAVVIGDSIGAQWSSMVAGVFLPMNWKVIVLTKSACAIVDLTYYYEAAGGDYETCAEWRENALQYVSGVRPDVVFIGSSASYDFTETEWVNGSSRILERLSAVSTHVVVIPGTPSLTFDGPSCLDDPYTFSFRLLDGQRECEESLSSSISSDVSGYLRRAADAYTNVAVLDLADLVCPNKRCAASTNDGIAVFRDKNHLTNSFVISTIPEVRQRIIDSGVQIDFH